MVRFPLLRWFVLPAAPRRNGRAVCTRKPLPTAVTLRAPTVSRNGWTTVTTAVRGVADPCSEDIPPTRARWECLRAASIGHCDDALAMHMLAEVPMRCERCDVVVPYASMFLHETPAMCPALGCAEPPPGPTDDDLRRFWRTHPEATRRIVMSWSRSARCDRRRLQSVPDLWVDVCLAECETAGWLLDQVPSLSEGLVQAIDRGVATHSDPAACFEHTERLDTEADLPQAVRNLVEVALKRPIGPNALQFVLRYIATEGDTVLPALWLDGLLKHQALRPHHLVRLWYATSDETLGASDRHRLLTTYLEDCRRTPGAWPLPTVPDRVANFDDAAAAAVVRTIAPDDLLQSLERLIAAVTVAPDATLEAVVVTTLARIVADHGDRLPWRDGASNPTYVHGVIVAMFTYHRRVGGARATNFIPPLLPAIVDHLLGAVDLRARDIRVLLAALPCGRGLERRRYPGLLWVGTLWSLVLLYLRLGGHPRHLPQPLVLSFSADPADDLLHPETVSRFGDNTSLDSVFLTLLAVSAEPTSAASRTQAWVRLLAADPCRDGLLADAVKAARDADVLTNPRFRALVSYLHHGPGTSEPPAPSPVHKTHYHHLSSSHRHDPTS